MPSANHYRFEHGADGELVYIDPATSGGRQLVYKGQVHTGYQVSTFKSEMGLLATVALDSVSDAYSRSLTLLVPPVNVAPPERTAHVNTWAIVAKSRTTKDGPDRVVGQVVSYELLNLAGTASRQIA